MVMQIFFPRCQTSPDMTFRFVHIQYLSGVFGKSRVDLRETFRYVFVNRTLANPKLFCRLSYCRIVLDNISGYFHSSFLNITFQKNPLRYLFLHCMQGRFFICHASVNAAQKFTHILFALFCSIFKTRIFVYLYFFSLYLVN